MRSRDIYSVVVLALICGCGEPSFPTVPLAGEVTIDGMPLEEGTIAFVPLEKGLGPEASTEIRAGKYQAQVPRGRLKVFLQGTRATGNMVEEYGVQRAELVNAIPAQYQAGIELDATAVAPERHFHLITPPR